MHSSFIVTFGGVSSLIGAGAMFVDGFLGAAALLAVIGVVGLLVGASMAGVNVKAGLRQLAPKPSSFAAVVAGLLLVTAAAGGGALGPDAQRAVEDGSPVGEAEAIACGGVCIGAGVGVAVGFAAGYIANEYMAGDDVSGVYAQADATETHIEVSTHADTIAVDQDTLDAVMANQVNDGSRSVAWSKGQAAAVKAMNAGANKSETKQAAREAVTEYYTTMQYNYVKSKSQAMKRVHYLDDVYNNGTSSNMFFYGEGESSYSADPTASTVDYTLMNGSTTNVTVVHYDIGRGWLYDTRDNFDLSGLGMDPGSAAYYGDGEGTPYWLVADYEANVTPSIPSTDSGRGRLIDFTQTRQTFEDMRSANQQMRNNTDLFVENNYANYTAGDINDSEILDTTTLAQEFATSYNDTGYYAYAAGDLALQGTNGSLDHSMVITLHNGSAGRTSDEVVNGTLFTDWAPAATNGTIETGYRYNASNADSLVYVATNDGLGVIEGEFTITEMTNVNTGEAVNSTELQNYNRRTADAGWTREEIDQLLEVQQELNEAQAAAGGGFSFGNIGGGGIAIAAAAALVLLLGTRD